MKYFNTAGPVNPALHYYVIFLLMLTNFLSTHNEPIVNLADALRVLSVEKKKINHYGVAIMLDVNSDDYSKLVFKNIYPIHKHLHVTIAFLELQSKELAEKVGKLGRIFLEEHLATTNYSFCVDKAAPLFGHVVALIPKQSSQISLKQLNLELEEYLKSEGFFLNAQTTNVSYIPHMTLSNKDIFENINESILSWRKNTGVADGPCLRLDSVNVKVL